MVSEQKSYDELWEKLRSKMEKKFAEVIRQQLQKEFERRLLEHREAIHKEISEEYDTKLNDYKKESETRIQMMMTEYEEKLRIQEDEAKQKMDRIRSGISEIHNLVMDTEGQSEVTAEPVMALKMLEKPVEEKKDIQKSAENQDEIPPILRPEFYTFLRDVVKELDPSSFLKFTRSNKKLRTMARQGLLRTSISLVCTTYEHSEFNQWFDDMPLSLVPSFNHKALGVKELNFLHSAKFFRTKMKCLCLIEETAQQGRFHDIGEKAMELLDYLYVQNIEELHIDAVMDIADFVKKYHVKDLRIHSRRMPPSFLQSPDMNRIVNSLSVLKLFIRTVTMTQRRPPTNSSWLVASRESTSTTGCPPVWCRSLLSSGWMV